MPALLPAIDTLGLAAPYIGPWFDDATLQLAAPDGDPTVGDLSVTLALTQPLTLWLPPTTGLLSLHVSTAPRPKPLQRLRKPDDSPAFNDDRLVALFTVLPEVADRLHALCRVIAPADGSAGGSAVTDAPNRAYVACLALEFPDDSFGWLASLLPSPTVADPSLSDTEVAAFFGLRLNADGIKLENDSRPMANLRRAGKLPLIGVFEAMLALPQTATGLFRLHAFDQRGRPLDPGAVAAWWAALGANFPDLWAMGLSMPVPVPGSLNDQRTALVAPALTGHLVNAHEAQVDDVLLARFDRQPAGMSAVALNGLFGGLGTGSLQLKFTAAPSGPFARDDAPVPRLAAMPSGRCAAQLMLWGTAASTPLTRDFVRVMAVELEEHLVGQKRVLSDEQQATATAEQNIRADDQQRWTTRVNIAQSAGPAFLTTVDAAAAAALAVVSGNIAEVVCNGLDAGWGPLPGLPAGAAPAAFPALPQVLVRPLLGGSADANTLPKRGQRVLMQFINIQLPATNPPAPPSFPSAFSGWWLRAWPVGFDFTTGARPVLAGGAGQIDDNGNASLVVELPDGAGTGQLGVRLSITAPGGHTRDFTEQRFNRPDPAGNASGGLAFGANGATAVLLCEQGQQLAPPLAAAINPGSTVVEVVPGGFALIDPATVPDAAYSAVSAAASFDMGDRLELTQPAFKFMPDGTVGLGGATNWSGAALNRVVRSGTDPLVGDSQPFASQERLDHAAASRAASLACVWTAPALARYHETGAHNQGHPGAPAAVEVHGTGVRLTGPAAHAVADHTQARIHKTAPALVTAATTAAPVPAAPAGANLWAAVLQTVAASVEGEQEFGDKVMAPNNLPDAYTFEPVNVGDPARAYESNPPLASDIKKWYDDHCVPKVMGFDAPGSTRLPASNPGQGNAWPAARVAVAKRAMDRRAQAAAWGRREAMASVAAAISRAEDFIYIETPALDQATVGVAPDAEILLGRLLVRLSQRPLLHLLLCAPSRLMPGWPSGIELQRNLNLRNAIGALQMFGGDRVAVFAPSAGQGRELRLTSTTVIVDDAYALTGSTHLWRRGLSFDGSLSVAVFDEVLRGGRPAEIVAFRRALIAQQLSLPALRVPDDPAALVQLVQRYNQQRSARVGHNPLPQPKLQAPPGPPPQNGAWQADDGWNPDGSYKPGASVLPLLYAFLLGNQGELA